MIKKLKTYFFLLILLPFQQICFSQGTSVKRIEATKNNRDIFIYSSNDKVVLWQPDSLILGKYDDCGNTIWNKKYSFSMPNRSSLKSGFSTLNGGRFAFVTTENHTTHRASRVTLIDSNGSIAWSQSFRLANYSMFSYSLMQNASGDLYIYGNASQIGGGSPISFVYKIDLTGTLQWVKSYSIGGIWGGALLTSDQGLLLRNGFKFIKLDLSGNVQWATSITDLGAYYFSSPIELNDCYIFTGTNSGSSLSVSFYKIDKQGNLATTHKKTINLNSIHRNIVKKTDSSFISILNAGFSRNLPTIIEFDKDLNRIKKNTLHLSNSNLKLTGSGVAFHSDNTPIVTGVVDSSFSYKPYFGVLDSNYKLGCDTTLSDSMYVEFVSQNPLSVTSTNLPSLLLLDNTFAEENLDYSKTTLCENFTASLSLGNDTLVCPGSQFILQNKTNSIFNQFNWSTGETTSKITITEPGTYSLTATNTCFGVSLTDTIVIEQYSFPSPIDSSKNELICKDEVITFDAFIPSGTYRWQDNSRNSTYSAIEPGNYHVDITSGNCTQRYFYTLRSCEELFIPNVFSPNGDNINDYFKVIYLGFESYKLTIYNRWGEVVFVSENRAVHWDGNTQNSRVSEGVYFYTLSIGDKTYKGNISVFR